MNLLAATAPERIGYLLAAAIVVAWVVYLLIVSRQHDDTNAPGTEVELAPNRRPGDSDEELEGPRLERSLGFALILLTVCSVGPLVYWLNEPSRQAGAGERFHEQAVDRGFSLFQPTDSPEHGAHFGCAKCHGSVGQGGSALYTFTDDDGETRQVTWSAPPLDTAALKFSDDELTTILTYGRANTPMPAWGVAGGGPMNDQQITDLVAYINSLTLTPAKAKEVSTSAILIEAKALGAEGPDAALNGEAIFRANCARCHTKGWAFNEPEVMGGGAFGPNLTNGAAVRQFSDIDNMIEFLGAGTEFAKPYGTRGVGGNEGGGMPGFSQVLSAEQIKAVAEYVRSL
ncbi:MAG: c-type cytochrome [Acidimicrobiales bacterium]